MINLRVEKEIFAVTEEEIPLTGWKREDGMAGLAAIERDMRDLMLKSAQARYSASEQENRHISEMKKHFLALLDIIDSFGRVFANIEKQNELITGKVKIWVGNFRVIYKLLLSTLEQQGIKRIENLDTGFDPNWHKSTEIVEDPSKEEGTIVEQLKPGYVWQGQILRKTEVVVVRR